MRSISIKLILAFICVSLVGILLIVALVRYNTIQEFKRFSSSSNESSLTAALQEYYTTNGSWAGIDSAQLFRPVQPPPSETPPARRDALTVTDVNGQVLRAGSNYALGDTVPADVLARGVPIQIDGKTVGFMIFDLPPFGANSPENAFLYRINLLLIYTAAGTLLISLLLGVLLSRTLTRPIRELTAATQAIAAGDLSLQVPVRSRDELGKLAGSFNRMSSELARSSNLRRQMTADIAHELRTPVSVILGHAEGVHDGVLPPSLETFEIVRDEAGRLDKLIEDLRTLSRADAGELPLERQPVSPGKLLAKVRAAHLHRAGQKRIALKTLLDPDLPQVPADPDRMMQVLSNLLDNALHFTPEGGEILLSARRVENMVEIGVQDNGPGVPPDELDRIFDRFYRSDPSRQRHEGGSGLGLAIARSIVEKHGGRIWAESSGGKGTKILIRLPVLAGS
jgi:two-component system sensor histidine kinase BaeS